MQMTDGSGSKKRQQEAAERSGRKMRMDCKNIGDWYFGPSVIALGAFAKDQGLTPGWYDRLSGLSVIREVPEIIKASDLDLLQKTLWKNISPTDFGRLWGKTAFQNAPTIWTLCAGSTSFEDILSMGSNLSLLDSNSYVIGFRPTKTSVRVNFYPLVPLPHWQHLMLVQQLALGFPFLVGDKHLVQRIVVAGEIVSLKALKSTEPEKGLASLAASQVVLRRSSLGQQNPVASQSWALITKSIVDPLIGMRLRNQPSSYRVTRALIESYLKGGPLDMVSVAGLLHTEKSTLRRHLKLEQNSFSKILAQFRVQEAKLRLITGGDVAKVSQDLGYEAPMSLQRLMRQFSTSET